MTYNIFAQCQTLADLREMYEFATSPENLWRDGEATKDEVEATQRYIDSQYASREKALLAGK